MDKVPPPPPKFNDSTTNLDRQRSIQDATRSAQDAAGTDAAPSAAQDRRVQQQAHPHSKPTQPPYTPPEWSGLPPPSFQYSLEVLKQGTIITHLPDLSSKPYWTFGRTPDNDIILDHPSSSRLHAILQFRPPPDPAAFLYDPGSSHGVFINKSKHPLPRHQYSELRVGDVFTLGQSSRMYIFGGAQELMPEEEEARGGSSKKIQQQQQQQQQDAAILEAMAKRRERDAAVAKAQMQAALASKSGGASWGMIDDDIDGEGNGRGGIGAFGEVDWRAYAMNNSLSDKQQKLADKIRKKESRIEQLSREIENIRAKQGMEELTAGQATTVMRNEGAIEVARRDIEELEDLLCDSIRSATTTTTGGADVGVKKRKQGDGNDDDDDDDDSVWDRTAIHNKTKKKKGDGGNGDDDDDEGALDVASLLARKETLVEEKEKLESDLQKAVAKRNTTEEHTAAAVEEEEEGGGGGATNKPTTDALDAFMSGLKTAMEGETVDSLKKQLDNVQRDIADVERLIKVADPDGWYTTTNPGQDGQDGGGGSKKRAEDVLRAKKKIQEEKAKQMKIEEEKKRVRESEQRGAAERAVHSNNTNTKQPVENNINIHRMEGDDSVVGGLQTMKKTEAVMVDEAGEAVKQKMEARRAEIAAKLSAMKREERGGGGGDGGDGNDVTASVLEDLALLRGAKAGYGAMAEGDGEREGAD